MSKANTPAPGSSVMRSVEEEQLPELQSLDAAKGRLGGEHFQEVHAVRQSLNTQEKETVFIPQRRTGEKPLPPVTVQINDYTYQIPRGVRTQVPAEVAQLVHEAGYLNL